MLVHRIDELIGFSFTSNFFFRRKKNEGASLGTLRQEDS